MASGSRSEARQASSRDRSKQIVSSITFLPDEKSEFPSLFLHSTLCECNTGRLDFINKILMFSKRELAGLDHPSSIRRERTKYNVEMTRKKFGFEGRSMNFNQVFHAEMSTPDFEEMPIAAFGSK